MAGPTTTSGSADERARHLPDYAGGDGPVECRESPVAQGPQALAGRAVSGWSRPWHPKLRSRGAGNQRL
eukprot:3173663-Pyramimonas_sp.AAC.1